MEKCLNFLSNLCKNNSKFGKLIISSLVGTCALYVKAMRHIDYI